ncbi:MAG: 2-hydroxyacyl-CoA dehydratase [Acidobacteriota bacterium]|nr:2-hydroxyacyl-CoA dehydratase [Acidobacteriota bacterium]MDE3169724.1 2-hydroxyacyl-CoA dehydratase [Acidobacteriota bacterium]
MTTTQVQEASRLEPLLASCREIIEDPDFSTAKRWLSDHPGKKAVGCFPIYCPVELIHASGMLPLGIIGAGNQIEIAHADSRFQSFVCSIVKSTLELGLTNRLEFLDGMLFHSICDPARNLSSVFQRNFPGMYIEYIHFPQNFTSPLSRGYLESEYRRVLNGLQERSGHAASVDDLNRSIALYNRIRLALRDLYQIRTESPHLISAAESFALLRAGTLMAPEDFLEILGSVLGEIPTRPARPKDRIRVVLEGSFCELPPIGLIETLEQAGCYIVEDDFLRGWRWFTEDVPISENPLASLATSYSERAYYSGTKHDSRESKSAHLLQLFKEKKADAVVFQAAKFCEPALFDYAVYRKALEGAKIPHLLLEFEEKTWSFDRARSEAETFVESLLFD